MTIWNLDRLHGLDRRRVLRPGNQGKVLVPDLVLPERDGFEPGRPSGSNRTEATCRGTRGISASHSWKTVDFAGELP